MVDAAKVIKYIIDQHKRYAQDRIVEYQRKDDDMSLASLRMWQNRQMAILDIERDMQATGVLD